MARSHRVRSSTLLLSVLAAASLLAVFMVWSSLVAAQTTAAMGSEPSSQSASTSGEPAAPAEADFTQFPGYHADGDRSHKLLIVPIEGMIDLGMAAFVKRSLAEVDSKTTVLLRISTFGGRIDAAVDIRDRILNLQVPSIAYVQNRAISAGALIALSADTLLLDKTSSVGAVTPVQQSGGGPPQPTSEKVVSYMRAEMRATAEAKGRRADIAEAMVDADLEVEGISEAGKLLTLTARGALDVGIADALVDSEAHLLEAMGLSRSLRVVAETDWGERLASFLTDGTVSSLLMTLGMAGLMFELYSPGFGLGGALGIACLSLFFGGHFAAELAGWEELLLLGFGGVLILVEVFVIPGFGIAGLSGVAFVCSAFVLAMIRVDVPVDVAFDLGYLQESLGGALSRLGFVLGALLLLGLAMAKYLPKTRASSFLVFARQPSLGGALPNARSAAAAHAANPTADSLRQVGDVGIARSVLRPGGIAEFDGRRCHVVSQGSMIDPGTEVRVVAVNGAHVVVEVS